MTPLQTQEKVDTRTRARQLSPGRDWTAWPQYEAAASGLPEYWYPVAWARQVRRKPVQVRLCGTDLFILRDKYGVARTLRDRCPHRGVKISLGKQWFPDTISCPYHGWTFCVKTGVVKAVITDGPDSRICGAAATRIYPTRERLGLIWVYFGDCEPHELERQLPEELVDPPPFAVGGRIEERTGNWRLFAENGFDEGHAKYLHRTSIWRIMKVMPTWNKIHVERMDDGCSGLRTSGIGRRNSLVLAGGQTSVGENSCRGLSRANPWATPAARGKMTPTSSRGNSLGSPRFRYRGAADRLSRLHTLRILRPDRR